MFERFKTENPDIKVGFSSFKKENPKQVKIVIEISDRSCLCQFCCNLASKTDSLKKYAKDTETIYLMQKLKDVNKTNVSNMTLCQFDSQPTAIYLNRECTDWGPPKFTEYLQERYSR